ncbi:coiled-coil domain-containing protein [Pseudomonas donghuensis]|uniref:hypothetical protein n=1 Tax=Pseudomonas donghuensis TaxID=1163398 RepID=UPI000C29EBB7|nr:hypothetical protein [Pseudomonas donghuensis]PJY96152.1 hypothetical protein COO64_11125 [Pseudomonas donghuensis]WKY27609.1 hypothetical protein QYF67_22495 [Pseudomonas donghuensis]
MKNLEQLNIERSKYEAEVHEIEGQIAVWEAHLCDPNFASTPAGSDLQICLREAESKLGGIEHKISVIAQDIARIDRKANSAELMTGYKATMENWSLDKVDLEGKREALSTRLAETKSQSEKVITNARQAEEEAARAYAQAVAWGDAEGERNAASDAQKAAKALSTALEHKRRQEAIIIALEQEVETIEKHIEEAANEILKAEKSAVLIALERLEEEWDVSVKELLAVGAKLYAAKRYMGWEQMAFHGFKVGSQIEGHTFWDAQDIATMSFKYSPPQIIDTHLPDASQVEKAA